MESSRASTNQFHKDSSELLCYFALLGGWLLVYFLWILGGATGERAWFSVSRFTHFTALLGVGATAAGVRLAAMAFDDYRQRPRPEHINWMSRAGRRVLFCLIALSFTGAVVSYMRWQSLGINPFGFQAETLYAMNVVYAQEGRVLSGLGGRLYSLGGVGALFVTYLYFRGALTRLQAVLLGCMFCLFLFSPRRAILFMAVLGVMFTVLAERGRLRVREMGYGMGVAMALAVLFVLTQFALGKIVDLSPRQAIAALSGYLDANLYVMDQLIRTSHFDDTWIMLSIPARVVGALFGGSPIVDLSIPFVRIPELANTVPAFYYFYKSAGLVGVVIWSLGMGFCAYYSVRMMKDRGGFGWTAAASLSLVGLLLSVRECLLLSYEFYYWILVAFCMDWMMRRSRRAA